MDMTEVSLTAAVRAALAVEMLRDLVEVYRDAVMDEACRGALMPQDVFVLHSLYGNYWWGKRNDRHCHWRDAARAGTHGRARGGGTGSKTS